jgi:hypothetical protein
MYYSQNIIYNKFKEKNNESKRLLSAAGSNTHSFFVCVLNEKQALFTDWYRRGTNSGKHVVEDHADVIVKGLSRAQSGGASKKAHTCKAACAYNAGSVFFCGVDVESVHSWEETKPPRWYRIELLLYGEQGL